MRMHFLGKHLATTVTMLYSDYTWMSVHQQPGYQSTSYYTIILIYIWSAYCDNSILESCEIITQQHVKYVCFHFTCKCIVILATVVYHLIVCNIPNNIIAVVLFYYIQQSTERISWIDCGMNEQHNSKVTDFDCGSLTVSMSHYPNHPLASYTHHPECNQWSIVIVLSAILYSRP